MDRPRPGANQTGAGSPTTQQGSQEETRMTESTAGASTGDRCWTYWVAYRHNNGLGAVAVSLGLPLRAACQLLMVARRIERDEDVRGVVVLSWQELLAPQVDLAARLEVPARLDGDVAVPELALRELIAAAERIENRVSTVTMDLLGSGLEMLVHLERPAPVELAGSLLADLALAGEPRTREHCGDNPFVVSSGTVVIGGGPVVVKVFCEVPV